MTMSWRGLIAATALSVLAASRGWSQAPQPEPAPPVSTRTPLRTRFAGQFTGDFDAMLDRRLIRLVVPYSPTAFFEDKGTIYGTAANGAQLFEHWINKTFALGARPLTVPLTPVSRDKLFDTLLAGDGDIAAGDITVTEERRKKVAFSAPVIGNVREIVITGEDIPELDSAEALSGKEVAVQRREDCPSARAHQNAEHELEFFDRRSPACEHQTEAQQATARQKDGMRAEPVQDHAPAETGKTHDDEVERHRERNIGSRPARPGRHRLQEHRQRKDRADCDAAHKAAGGDDNPAVAGIRMLYVHHRQPIYACRYSAKRSSVLDQPMLCSSRPETVANPSCCNVNSVRPGPSSAKVTVTTVSGPCPAAPPRSQRKVKTRLSGGTISRYTPLD